MSPSRTSLCGPYVHTEDVPVEYVLDRDVPVEDIMFLSRTSQLRTSLCGHKVPVEGMSPLRT